MRYARQTRWVVIVLFAVLHSLQPRIAVSSPVSTNARPQSSERELSDAAARAHASSVLEALHAASGVPGLAAALSINGEVVWDSYYGFSDLESKEPVTPRTRFRIGSVSKAITAVTLVHVWQRGGIDLDAKVQRYVPEFPEKEGTITPRLLAGHLAGIRNYEAKDFTDSNHIDRRHFTTTSEALTIFAEDSLMAPPGQRYFYSVFGYTLLAAALERATGTDFLSLLQSEIIEPLGLRHTGADSAGVPGLATPYERTANGGASVSAPIDLSYKWAGGGLYSNVRDLARLGSALLDPEFLTPAALDLLVTSQRTLDGTPTGVSVGWRVGGDSRDRRFIHHAGSISGGRAVVMVYPDHGLSVAISSNQALAPLMIESTAQVLAEPFLLRLEGEHVDYIRQQGQFTYSWVVRGIVHSGMFQYGARAADDVIELHPELAPWTERLGSPVSDTASILPMLVTGRKALIPVVTPAGSFGIDVEIDDDDSLTGEVVGQSVRVAGEFRATRRAQSPE